MGFLRPCWGGGIGLPLASWWGVAIRITSRQDGPTPVLQVDGWLVAEEAGALLRAVEEVGSGAALDLGELRSADRQSIEVLRGLLLRGIEFREVSQLIQAQLGSDARRHATGSDEPGGRKDV